MFLIVRTSDLSSLARRASVLPLRSAFGPFPAPPRLAPLGVPDRARAFEGNGLVGCCGCVAPDGLDGIGQEMPPEPIGAVAAPISPEPMGFAPPPPPFSSDPERARFVPGIEDVARDAEREQFERRLAALLPEVERVLGGDDGSKRVERANEEALEEAEDRAFAALVELLMIARSEARALRRARRA